MQFINVELLRPANFLTLGIIIAIWLTIHKRIIKPLIVKDGGSI